MAMFARACGYALGLTLLAVAGTPVATADEMVRFDGATYPPSSFQLERARRTGVQPVLAQPQKLEGWLRKPDGNGPFPAVVVLHGCGGVWRWDRDWSERLTEWGYVALIVDSLGPRGLGSVCKRPGLVSGEMRALDAHGAKSFLSTLPFVDPARIAVMGMSHGGYATLNAIQHDATSALGLKPFDAAIALYPSCDNPVQLDAPVQILIGDQDDWSSPEHCRQYVENVRSSYEVVLKEYPGAHHLFDLAGVDEQQEGHILRYDPQAALDAYRQVQTFLARHLGPAG